MTESKYKMKQSVYTKSLSNASQGFIYFKSGLRQEDVAWGNPLQIIRYGDKTLEKIIKEHEELSLAHKELENKYEAKVIELEEKIKALQETVNALLQSV